MKIIIFIITSEVCEHIVAFMCLNWYLTRDFSTTLGLTEQKLTFFPIRPTDSKRVRLNFGSDSERRNTEHLGGEACESFNSLSSESGKKFVIFL